MSGLAQFKKAPTYPNYLDYIGYSAIHVACLGAIWTGVTVTDIIVCAASYFVRMFGVMVGFHRYFSHRSFKATRGTQFALALLGTLGVQKGVLWWAAHHRFHHRYSDTEVDVHSPMQRSFLYSHCGWQLDKKNRGTDYTRVADLMKYPEIVWLNDWDLIPQALYAGVIFVFFGWSGVFWGFFISTILLWHAIHGIGSFGHRFGGYRRFITTDNSRNKWFLAILLLGEGWHNNHHFYPSSARQGFVWWEIDIGYYILKVLSWFGLVWDLRVPPEELISNPEPSVQSTMKRFAAWVQGLRKSLHRSVDENAKDATDDEKLALNIFKQGLEARIDAFDADATNLMLKDPGRLGDAELRLRSAMVEETQHIKENVSASITAALPEALQRELSRSLTTCPFRHLLPKEAPHAA
ncbi:acyl-CoA desaturase [Sorangium sp. So ce1000]|uniref:acyl-CoA desaturase n=1 Tax=Sorangium sp. So ce1000 TaxID=3133325 RepID=UPI003F5FAE09